MRRLPWVERAALDNTLGQFKNVGEEKLCQAG